MRDFQRKFQSVVCAAILFFCGLFFGGQRSFVKEQSREATAEAETSAYLPVYHSDFEIAGITNKNTYYIIALAYTNTTTGGLPQNRNTKEYSPQNLPLYTDDEDILHVKNVTAHSSGEWLLFNIFQKTSETDKTGFAEANPSKIIIPAGTRLDRPSDVTDSVYAGIYFAENVILSRKGNDDAWEMAECVHIEKKIGEDTETENVAIDETYTFSAPTSIARKTFIGWKLNGTLYAVGESVKVADFLVDGAFPVLEAVYVSYALEEGASIRYDSTLVSSGIRFTALLDKADFQTYQEYIVGVGVILMPNDKIGNKEFTLQNYSGEGEAKNVYVEKNAISFDNKDKFTLRVALVSVLEKNYNRDFSARAYLLISYHGGATTAYVWDSYISTRSVCQVAQLALDENETKNNLNDTQKSILKAYVGKANAAAENEEA